VVLLFRRGLISCFDDLGLSDGGASGYEKSDLGVRKCSLAEVFANGPLANLISRVRFDGYRIIFSAEGYKMKLEAEICGALLEAVYLPEALQKLIDLKKKKIKTFSLATLSKKCGLSKSYLSEVITGKKPLHLRAAPELGKALGLGYLEAACFEALLLHDRAKTLDEKALTLSALEKSKKILRMVAHEETAATTVTLLEFDVYAAFGVFGGTPTKVQLCAFFSHVPRLDVYHAIDALVLRKAIEKEGNDRLKYTTQGFVFNASEKSGSFFDLWKQSLADASTQLPNWAHRPNESCFASYVVSVKKELYMASLEQFKNQILTFAANSDAADADALVRINVQIYPVVRS
jgi:uncharacterized protein (TIGR02147 family)